MPIDQFTILAACTTAIPIGLSDGFYLKKVGKWSYQTLLNPHFLRKKDAILIRCIEFAIALSLTMYLESYFSGIYSANPERLAYIIAPVAIGDYLLIRKLSGFKYTSQEKVIYGLMILTAFGSSLKFVGFIQAPIRRVVTMRKYRQIRRV